MHLESIKTENIKICTFRHFVSNVCFKKCTKILIVGFALMKIVQSHANSFHNQIQLLNCRNNVKCDQMFCIFLEAGICRCVSADVDGLVAGWDKVSSYWIYWYWYHDPDTSADSQQPNYSPSQTSAPSQSIFQDCWDRHKCFVFQHDPQCLTKQSHVYFIKI